MSSLELASFKGSAGEVGVEIHDGVFDSGVDLRLPGDGTVAASTRLVFTDLSIEEPADGPIARCLSLPAPLDAAIFILRDADGSLEIPLDFECGSDGIGAAQILAAGVGALASMIGNAIASSPFRVAGAMSSLVTGEVEEKAEEPIALDFEPGATAFPAAHARQLAPLLERLRDDEEIALTLRHELGRDDLAIAAIRVNPSRADCLDLFGRLRQRRLELLERRARLAAQTRAAHATGDRLDAVAGRERLSSVDTQLGETERALDDVLELLRPGAERQATRRTRDACIAIGKARLRVVREALLLDPAPDLEDRIQIVRPRYTVSEERRHGAVTITPSVRRVPRT